MFCQNCGTQISDNERFCGKCGTPVEQVATQVNKSTPNLNATSNTPIDGSLAMMFITSAVLFFVQIILWFVDFGKYSMTVDDLGIERSGAYSIHYLMGSTAFSVIMVIIMIVCIGLCLLPIIKNTLGQRRRMIFQKIVVFVNAFWFVMSIFSLSDYISSNEANFESQLGSGYFSGSWGLTFGGWLNVIVLVGTLILLFKISSKTKKVAAFQTK